MQSVVWRSVAFSVLGELAGNAEPQAPPQMCWVRIPPVTRAPSDFSCTLQTNDVWYNAYRVNCSHLRLLMLNLTNHYLFKLLYRHRCNFTNLYWVSCPLIMWTMTNTSWFCRNLGYCVYCYFVPPLHKAFSAMTVYQRNISSCLRLWSDVGLPEGPGRMSIIQVQQWILGA